MTRNLKIAFLVAALCPLVFSSCDKGKKDALTDPVQDAVTAAQKIKKLGFDTSNIIPFNEGYIVENDIFLSSKDLDKKQSESQTKLRIAKNEQYRTTNFVTGLPRVLTVRFPAPNRPDFSAVLFQVVKDYNDLKLDLTFQMVSGASADITILPSSSLPYGTLGITSYWPSGGSPGSQILINETIFNTTSLNPFLVSVIKHEMGHAIGLKHTDYMNRAYSCGGGGSETDDGSGYVNIPGTPTGPDRESFMLACVPDASNPRGFVDNDILALSYMYNIDHTARAQVVNEYYSPTGQDHAYYINQNIPRIANGWNFNGAAYRAFIQQAPGTQRLWEYYNPVNQDHCMTFVENDIRILQYPNWHSNGPNFYAYPTQVPGSIPIYEFGSASMSTHCYSPNYNFTVTFPQFNNHGIAFYALPL